VIVYLKVFRLATESLYLYPNSITVSSFTWMSQFIQDAFTSMQISCLYLLKL